MDHFHPQRGFYSTAAPWQIPYMVHPHAASRSVPPLGPRIAAARESARLTQAELAEMLGLRSPETISRYERGEREPRFSSLCRLATALGISVDALIDGSESGAKPRASRAAPVDPPDAPASTAPVTGSSRPNYQLGTGTAMGRSHAALLEAARRDLQRLHDLDPDAALLALGQIVELTDAALRRVSRAR